MNPYFYTDLQVCHCLTSATLWSEHQDYSRIDIEITNSQYRNQKLNILEMMQKLWSGIFGMKEKEYPITRKRSATKDCVETVPLSKVEEIAEPIQTRARSNTVCLKPGTNGTSKEAADRFNSVRYGSSLKALRDKKRLPIPTFMAPDGKEIWSSKYWINYSFFAEGKHGF